MQSSSARRLGVSPRPTPARFARSYVAKRRPILFEGLFAGQPIDRIRTRAEARKRLGEIVFRATTESARPLLRAILRNAPEPPPAPAPRQMTLAVYLDHVDAEPDTTWMCSEQPLAPQLRATFEVPALCKLEPGADDLLMTMFVGNAGNVAHMHFDGDFRHVLFHQVFGRKRITLIPPRSAAKLMPMKNQGCVLFDDFTPRERARFLDYVEGIELVIEPGQALLMPAAWWHHVEYLSDSLSFNVRFGRNRHARFLAENLHLGAVPQNLGDAFSVAADIGPLHRTHFDRIRRAHFRRYAADVERYNAMVRVCDEAFAVLCPKAMAPPFAASNLGRLEALSALADYEQRREIKAGQGRSWPDPADNRGWATR